MQKDAGENWLQVIDKATLTPLVRSALSSNTIEIADWDYRSLTGGVGDQGEGLQGLFRFAGNGRDHNATVDWSLILKFSKTDAHGGDPVGGQRERLAYRSGVLENLSGIVVPRCFGIDELPGGLSLIWLEEITESYDQWPLERYGMAARHLGQFNGAYLTNAPLPEWPWMSRGWLRWWVKQAALAIAQLPEAVQYPLVRRCYPLDVEANLLRLWDAHEQFLDTLGRPPQTVCHMDAFRRNLFSRRDADGEEETVAIDWAFTGIGAVGEELAPLIMGSVGFNEVDLADLMTLDEIVFNHYLEGLHEAGWHGDPRSVRFGYAAAAAMRYGVGIVRLVLPGILDEAHRKMIDQAMGLSTEARMDRYAVLNRYLLKLATEARDLLDDIP